MGRMLETLKLGESRRAPVAMAKPGDAAVVQDCVVDWEIGAEVPFVEVGGPGKKVELSPGLMKHPPQSLPQAPHLPVESASAPAAGVAKQAVVNLIETRPMTAAFEAWPMATPTAAAISADIIAYHQPEHPSSKAYAALLSAMRGNLKTEAAHVLLLVGLKPNVGTSTVLLNLAVCAAMQKNLRVVVVDGNLQNPGLAKRFGHSASAGLTEVLGGTLALEQAIVKTGIPSLDLLPAGKPSKTQRPLTLEAMTWLIAWLRDRCDLILIDGPTLEETAGLAMQAPQADGIYLVLPQGEAGRLDKGIAHSIGRVGGRLCGLIHTHFEV